MVNDARVGVGMSSNLVRWGGLAGVLAGVMFVLAGILNLIASQQRVSFNSFSDYLSEIILVVAFAVTLVVIARLHILQRGATDDWERQAP
jgi:hypothetical protein